MFRSIVCPLSQFKIDLSSRMPLEWDITPSDWNIIFPYICKALDLFTLNYVITIDHSSYDSGY